MRYLTVALAKGRLAELAMELFISIGMDCSEMKEKTRKLIFTDEKNKMKFILVKRLTFLLTLNTVRLRSVSPVRTHFRKKAVTYMKWLIWDSENVKWLYAVRKN